MSSLVGAITIGPASVQQQAELARLVEAVGELRGEKVVRSWSSPRVSAIRLSSIGADASSSRDAGRQRAGSAGGTWSAQAESSEDGGPYEALATWQRPLALIGEDAGRAEAVVATDGLGLQGVYVHRAPGRWLISTSSLALARIVGAGMDAAGVRSFLATGLQVGQRTYWQDITRLEPGHRLVIDRHGRERIERYWRPEVDPSAWREGLDSTVRRVEDVALSAYRAQFTGTTPVLDLTGGYDSRLSCLLMAKVGVDFATTTRTVRDERDLAIAAAVAGSRGWPWIRTDLPPGWGSELPHHVHAALGAGDGRLDVLQLARVLEQHRHLAVQHPMLVSGGGGEHFQYAGWKTEFGTAGLTRTPNVGRWVRMRLFDETSDALLEGGTADVCRDLTTTLSAWIRPWSGQPATVQLDAAYAYVKAPGHFGAYRGADTTLFDARLPLYSRPVFEAVFTTHHRWRNAHRLMRRLIVGLDSAIAALPTTRGGPATPFSAHDMRRFTPYATQLLGKAYTKLRRDVVGGSSVNAQAPFPWLTEANDAVAATHRHLFDSESRIGDLVSESTLDHVVSGRGYDPFRRGVLLGRLLTAELALRASP